MVKEFTSTIIIARKKLIKAKAWRMLHWFLFSALLYAIALCCPLPLIAQAALTKGANVNVGAFLGYWIDRTLFAGFDNKFDSTPEEVSDASKACRLLGRAIIVGACILGLSTGVGA